MADDFNRSRHLFRFSVLEHENLVDEEDIIGFEVINEKNESLGRVVDLVIDSMEGVTRYYDVQTNTEFSHSQGDRHLFLSIDGIDVNRENRILKVAELDRDLLLRFPIIRGGAVALDYEHTLREVLSPNSPLEGTKSEYYKELTDEPGIFDPSSLAPNPDHYFSSPNP